MYKKYRITYIDYLAPDPDNYDEPMEFSINTVDLSIKNAIDSFYKEYSDCDIDIKSVQEIK